MQLLLAKLTFISLNNYRVLFIVYYATLTYHNWSFDFGVSFSEKLERDEKTRLIFVALNSLT